MKKLFNYIFLCILITSSLSLIGCNNSNTVIKDNSSNVVLSEVNEEDKYEAILNDNKSYETFNNEQKQLFLELIQNWESQDEGFKNKYKSKKENLEAQKEDLLRKEHEESREVYKDFICDIQSSFPEMKVDYITGSNNDKTLFIKMNLLNNVDNTTYKCSELAVSKETIMKDNNISKIEFFFENNGNDSGFLFFELQNGKYNPTINQIK